VTRSVGSDCHPGSLWQVPPDVGESEAPQHPHRDGPGEGQSGPVSHRQPYGWLLGRQTRWHAVCVLFGWWLDGKGQWKPEGRKEE